MKEIALSQGKFALVDDEDFEELNRYKWWVEKHRNTFYAKRDIWNGSKKVCIRMHRVLLNCPETKFSDHVDGNGLNNQKANLRIATNRQNLQNRHVSASSKYPGVSWQKNEKKWQSAIYINGKSIHLGLFNNEEEAFEAYASKVYEIGENMLGVA
jgi:hypothetical protein